MAKLIQTITYGSGRAEVFESWTHIYTTGKNPVVTYLPHYDEWRPFAAEHDGDGRQVNSLPRDVVEGLIGATDSVMQSIEAAAKAALTAAKAALVERDEVGRKSWQAMTKDERDAVNAHALRTEGHTVD